LNIVVHTPKLEAWSERWVPFFWVSTADHLNHHRKLQVHYASPCFNIDNISRQLFSKGGKSWNKDDSLATQSTWGTLQGDVEDDNLFVACFVSTNTFEKRDVGSKWWNVHGFHNGPILANNLQANSACERMHQATGNPICLLNGQCLLLLLPIGSLIASVLSRDVLI
jgi:hypothetical protein